MYYDRNRMIIDLSADFIEIGKRYSMPETEISKNS